MRLLLSLLLTQIEAMSFFMALFYVLSRASAFQTRPGQHGLRTFLIRYVFFTGITITGSYLGIQLPGGVIANTRAVGAIVSGFVGGPWLGLAVGASAVEMNEGDIGRIRLRHASHGNATSLQGFVVDAVKPGSLRSGKGSANAWGLTSAWPPKVTSVRVGSCREESCICVIVLRWPSP